MSNQQSFEPTSTISGFKDNFGEDLSSRNEMIARILEVYKKYGYQPLETPAVEKWDTLTGKSDDKLIYRIEGSRDLALHFDLTVPMARFLAVNQGKINYPFMRYQAQPAWRKETAQKGRFNEFWQVDADRAGEPIGIADIETVAMMCEVMEQFKVKYSIMLNDRRIFDALSQSLGFKPGSKEAKELIILIDKADKIGIDGVVAEIESRLGSKVSQVAKKYLQIKGSNSDKISQVAKLLSDNELVATALKNISDIIIALQESFPEPKLVYTPRIARGLDYYTSTVFETVLTDMPSLGSVYSGGRYDELVAKLGGPSLPAIGASVGISRLHVGLKELGALSGATSNPQLMVLNMGEQTRISSLQVAQLARNIGVRTFAFGGQNKKIADQLKLAESKGASHVLIVGEDEQKKGEVVIRNLETRTQDSIPMAELQSKLKTIF